MPKKLFKMNLMISVKSIWTNNFYKDENCIVEIKTSIKKNSDDLTNLFPFQRIRFSKYCFAVDNLKQTG